jgi:hypothetical protein
LSVCAGLTVSEFHRHAPTFVWVAQNFKVKWLTGPDGAKMSPTEVRYLHTTVVQSLYATIAELTLL